MQKKTNTYLTFILASKTGFFLNFWNETTFFFFNFFLIYFLNDYENEIFHDIIIKSFKILNSQWFFE